jgi:NhaA family Na+:H+ antiporter
VDDLLGILVIGIVYTDGLRALPFLLALVPVAGFALVLRRRGPVLALLPVLAVAAWLLVHASGVHPTIAGVLLGFAVPSDVERMERLEHRLRPVSAGVAVPVFAFFAAGVTIAGGGARVANALTVSIVLALVRKIRVERLDGAVVRLVVAAGWRRKSHDGSPRGRQGVYPCPSSAAMRGVPGQGFSVPYTSGMPSPSRSSSSTAHRRR